MRRVRLMSLMFKAHPWHGVSMGDHAPDVVTAYIEIVPTDTVKYEVDKASGFLKVDRPQRFSNFCPVILRADSANLLRRAWWRSCSANAPTGRTWSATAIRSISAC